MNTPAAQRDLPDEEEEAARALLDQLLDESRLYKSSTDYMELLEFSNRLRNFAPFNAMLLHIQKPGMRYAASQADWWWRFRRTIKEKARPLLILWPFCPVALVYDVQDTEGGQLPDDVNTFTAHGDMTEARIQTFMEKMRKKGVECSLFDGGDGDAGSIQLTARGPKPQEAGSYKLFINSNHLPPTKFVTIAHELAHLFLGHLGPDKALRVPDRPRPAHDQEELEAESVAYLVCARNGVESKSKTYLADYVNSHTTIETMDVYQVMKAAGQIEALLELTGQTAFRPSLEVQEKAKESLLEEQVTNDESYTESIPVDLLSDLVNIARELVSEGVEMPEQLAASLTRIGPDYRQYSEAVWSVLRAGDTSLCAVADWPAIYAALDKS